MSQGKVLKSFDSLGRLTRYTDAKGGVTDTVFDQYGKPISVSDNIGTTQSFTYDRALEPRGLLTKVTDSVAGTITAEYGPDGQLLRQNLPGGISLHLTYDAAVVDRLRDPQPGPAARGPRRPGVYAALLIDRAVQAQSAPPGASPDLSGLSRPPQLGGA